MYGGSVKLGRGGSAAGRNRNINVQPINRNLTAVSGSRLSAGGNHAAGHRGRGGGDEAAPGPSTSCLQTDETYSLVTRNPLNFAMALRLVPDLVEEINRVEAMGGTARIKFDCNVNNSSGNVISVGDKNFNFTWSRETGELCDIYEECKNCEDGNGLLMESGGTWRRLNVQRVLDESTKKHVKMLSEEAERKSKSRKSIVLDDQNLNMKSQGKALAAAESNSRRIPFKRKEVPPKKPKLDPSSGGGLPKPVYKSGLASYNTSKSGSATGSPLSSQTKQHGAVANPVTSSNFMKGNSIVPDATPQATNKTPGLDKDVPRRLENNIVRDKPKANSILQSILPDAFDQLPAQDRFISRNPGNGMVDKTNVNPASGYVTETKETFNIPHDSPVHSDGKKISDNGDGLAASSSDGGSDSDTESKSSDSGSDSESLSKGKSKSPVGSRSGSSSDSESDSYSSNKQAPDEDVDIMTSDDEKGQKSVHVSSKSLFQVSPRDNEPAYFGNHENQDDWVSDMIGVEKSNPGDEHDSEGAATNNFLSDIEKEDRAEENKKSSAYEYGFPETQGNGIGVKNVLKQRGSDDHTKFSKGKSKRCSDDQSYGDAPRNGKRLKGKNSSQPFSLNSLFGESPQSSSPDEPPDSPFRGPINQGVDRDVIDGSYNTNFQTDLDQRIQTGSISESQISVKRPFNTDVQAGAPFGEKPSSKYGSVGFGVEDSENGLQTSKSIRTQNQNTDALHEAGLVAERPAKFPADNVGDKHLTVTESVAKRHKSMAKVKDFGRPFKVHKASSPKDKNSNAMGKSPILNGKQRVLQRELSELELGEFHESSPNEIPGPKKLFDRTGNHRHVGSKPIDSFTYNSDSNSGKPSKKTSLSRDLSPHISNSIISELPGGLTKQKALGNTFMESEKVQSTNLEAQPYRKMSSKATEQRKGPKRTGVSQSKDVKKHEFSVLSVSQDKQNDVSSTGNYDIEKRTDSSLDEMTCSYTKYEKEEPQLKYPIKDLSEYREYVKEYQEKYESYSSFYKILESYRVEFGKLGNDLETYRGWDNKKYEEILGQIRSSFRQCGEKHKRLTKIFSVLHEELKQLKEMIKDYAASYTKD